MSFSSGGGAEVLRADYVLQFTDRGLSQATRLDRTLRDSIKQTSATVAAATATVDRMSSRQAEAWTRTARVASESQRRIADGHIAATRRIDSSITKTVDLMRKMGMGYEEIARYMRAYRTDAEQTAAAVERSAAKEIAALDRVERARSKLRSAVGLGPSGGSHGMGGREARGLERGVVGGISERARYGAGYVGGGLVAGVAGYLGVSAIRGAADSTAELAKQSVVLSRFTGMSKQTALEFSAIAQAYGVSSRSLGMSFRSLGTQIDSALTKPTESNTRAFRQLGITQQEVKAHAHDLGGMLGIVADHLNKMPPGAEKTADAAKLLGRNWMALAPVLADGSKGLQANLDVAKKVGVEMGGNTTANMLKLHEASIQLKLAQIGLEIEFTQHILPALLKLMEFGIKVYGVIRTNLGPVFHWLGGEIHAVSGFLKQHTTILKAAGIAVTALASGFVALKVIGGTVRLVRGLTSDVRSGIAMFKALASPLESAAKLFGVNQTAEERLMKVNASLAQSNMRLAASYDEMAASAKIAGAAQGGGIPGIGGGLGGGGGLGRAASTAEKGAASEVGAVESLAGAGGGARAAETVAEDVGSKAGLLSRFGGLASGAMGAFNIAGLGMIGAQLGGGLLGSVTGNRHLGSAVSAIGSGAALGAGIGSVIPGVGTLIGGGVGAGIGALQHFVGLGGVESLLGFGPSKAQADASRLIKDTQTKINGANRETLSNLQKRLTLSMHEGGLTKQQTAAVQGALTARGLQVAAPALSSTMQGIATSRFAPSSAQIYGQTVHDLMRLPGQAQRIGSEAMIKFAAGMERGGKLPRGTTDKLIADLEARYGPKLQQRLAADSAASMRVFSDNIKTADVLKQVQAQVDSIHQKWSLVAPDAKVQSGNFVSVVSSDMKALEGVIAHSTGKQHDVAVAAYADLRQKAGSEFDAMLVETTAKQAAITKAIAGGSADAANQASSNFSSLYNNVHDAMAAGVLSTQQGAKMISDALNATLKAYGAKPVPVNIELQKLAKTLPNQRVAGIQQGGGGGTQLKAAGAALGGRVPGPVGPDNWTLIDPSGVPAARVGGAEILVANRHTEARVDAMLSLFGTSLGQEVSGESRMHAMARGGRLRGLAGGGVVTASMYGGPGDPGTGSTGYRGDNLYAHPDSFAELAMGTALGGLPYLAPLDVTYHGRTARLRKRDIGAGGPGIGGHPRAVDLWFQAAQALGFGGLDLVSINGPGGVGVSIPGGGSALGAISAPGVKGTGSAATLTRRALGKMAGAANAYLSAHGPSANVSVGGAMGFSGPKGLGTFDGVRVADWIVPVLNWARQHGWAGHVTSGYRPGYDPHAAGGHSEHGLTQWPGGAIDVGGPAAVAEGTALYDVLKGYPGHPNLKWGGIYITGYSGPGGHDYGHFSGTGMARGGRLRGFAGGGSTTSLGWTYPSGSTGSHRRPHHGRGQAAHMHRDPFTGVYRLMTASEYSALRDRYIAQYGHPPTAGHGPGRASHPAAIRIHWDPFTDSYKMMTTAQYQAQVVAPYFRRYHRPPPTRPATHHRPAHHAAARRTSAASVAAGTATSLAGGFDLGYLAGLDPGGSGVTDWQQAIAAAISGSSGGLPLFGATGTLPMTFVGSDALAHGGRGIRLRIHSGHGAHTPAPSPYAGRVGGGHAVAGDWATDPTMGYAPESDVSEIIAELPIDVGPQTYGGQYVNPASHAGRIGTRTVDRSVRAITAGGSRTRVSGAFDRLGKTLDNVEQTSYARLTRIQAEIQRHVSKVKPGSAEAKRLGQALQLVEYQEGKRVGQLVKAATDQADALAGASTRLQRLMQRQGIASGSARADKMMEQFDAQAVKVLQSSVAGLQKALALAKKAGDKNAVSDVSQKLSSALDQLDQAVTDQIQAQRDAVEAVASEAVASAGHASTLAQAGEQGLSLQQQLSGTSGTFAGAQQMAGYIRSQIIPSLQGELGALQAQRAAAQSVGDQTLADQIAEAIAGKQNDILQAQLDAQDAIKAATQQTAQDLSQLSGATGFDFGGQQFTDAIAAGVGA